MDAQIVHTKMNEKFLLSNEWMVFKPGFHSTETKIPELNSRNGLIISNSIKMNTKVRYYHNYE